MNFLDATNLFSSRNANTNTMDDASRTISSSFLDCTIIYTETKIKNKAVKNKKITL